MILEEDRDDERRAGGQADDRGRRRGRCSTRPSADRPTSCSTPARTTSSTPMRHSTAHVMAEAVLDLFPGTKLGIGPAIADGFYYDFDLPRAADAGRPGGDRGADARERRRRPPVRAQRAPAGRGPGVLRRARPAVQGRDPRRPRREGGARRRRRCRRRRSTSTARSSTCAGARTSRRPGRSGRSSCWRSPARTGAATRSGRCSSASTARSGRPRRSSTQFLWRRAEAKKRDHRRLGVQLDLFSFHDVSPGLGLLAPQGPAHLALPRDGHARAPGAARLPGGLHPDPRERAPVAAIRPLGPLPGQHVPDRVGRPDVQPQADELPREHVHLPLAPAFLPRPAAALQRVRPAASKRALRDAERPDPRPPVHPGRRPHLRPAGPADGRDPGAARRGPRGVRLVRAEAALHLRDEARQGDRRPGAVGARRAPHDGGVRCVRHQLRAEAQGRHVLRAQDRHLHRRRPRARMADGDDPDRPDDASRAVRPDLHRRVGRGRSPDRASIARSTAASSGSSASSSSTSRARSRSGSRRSRRS